RSAVPPSRSRETRKACRVIGRSSFAGDGSRRSHARSRAGPRCYRGEAGGNTAAATRSSFPGRATRARQSEGDRPMKTLAALTLAAGLAVAALPSPTGAETLRIIGDESTGLTSTVDGDGSVTKVAIASFDGLLADVEGSNRVLGRAQFTMTMVTSGDEL